MKEYKNQSDLVLSHFKKYGEITSYQAFIKYGITRLSAVIYNLKKDGYTISRKDVTSKNKYGKIITYGVYELREAKNANINI